MQNKLAQHRQVSRCFLSGWNLSEGHRPRVGIPLTPDRAPNPHFLEKRVSGSKNPISPRSGKGSFPSKNPLFSAREHIENGDFWTENSLFRPV